MSSFPDAPPVLRREALRDALLATVSLLKNHRAAEIDASFIEDYVALNWLEWNGGGLRLTITGSNVCKQLTVRPV
ncbi:MAG: hypothetical protein IV094_15875 [Vitreoscilla sp.]|nr:hypothetical protein [Vitreoscilla sp.]